VNEIEEIRSETSQPSTLRVLDRFGTYKLLMFSTTEVHPIGAELCALGTARGGFLTTNDTFSLRACWVVWGGHWGNSRSAGDRERTDRGGNEVKGAEDGEKREKFVDFAISQLRGNSAAHLDMVKLK